MSDFSSTRHKNWGKGGYGGKPWKVSLCSYGGEARAFRRAPPLTAIRAIAALVAWAPVAHAQTVPPALGADLLRSCDALIAYAKQRGEITADATSCAAYLKGLRDAMEASSSRNFPEQQFCAEGASLDDMARAVVGHLKDRAESVRRQAAVEALTALNRAYPCTPKKPGA